VTIADELREKYSAHPDLLYRLTRIYALSIPAVEEARRPRNLTAADRELQATYLDKALTSLEQAVAQGNQEFFNNPTHADLAPLRGDARFDKVRGLSAKVAEEAFAG
jgi:hypothetical protein